MPVSGERKGSVPPVAQRVAERALGTVPTAHTCDNVLELPNYWALLVRAEGGERALSSQATVRGDCGRGVGRGNERGLPYVVEVKWI